MEDIQEVNIDISNIDETVKLNTSYGTFTVFTKNFNTVNGPVEEVILKFHNLTGTIRNTLSEITGSDIFYETDEIPIKIFSNSIVEIKNNVESGNYELIELLDVLNEHFKNQIMSLNNMLEDNKITFSGLSSLFAIGKQFIAKTSNKLVGSIVSSTKMESDGFSRFFKVTGNFYFSRKGTIVIVPKSFYIPEFPGVSNINDLSVRPATEQDIEMLTNRGKIFIKYAKDTHFVNYNGMMFRNTNYGQYNFNANGRIMIDSKGCQLNLPNYISGHETNIQSESILPDFTYMCWPYLLGFSFTAKQWGEVDIDLISDIVFKDKAFDSLVLDNDIKKIVKSLVINSNDTFTDIIDGKSGGCIFLLHGPPGVGKTLTSEAIAEYLHKPLYSVGVGELGTTPDNLEKKLNSIIELAHSWNAIILIDECDIFMEARNTSDVNRNAMVAIFLRLLERHQGVMFLTTNRIDTMDAAFRSRISMIIDYDNLDYNATFKIWHNLLEASNLIQHISDLDITDIIKSSAQLNGRQIKSAIRMAQSIAKADNVSINKDIIKSIIKYL